MPTSDTLTTDQRLTVRALSTIEDFQRAESVQSEIWTMNDLTQVIPLHVLLTAQKNGGLVAAAFLGAQQMVGLLFGFIGLTLEGKYKHCSHLMGIMPEVRRQNVGQALKLFQREYVLRQGLDLVTWTFDPLEGVNASLNIAKLGGIVHHYYPDLYGSSMADSINSGLPTDRFGVEWWIDSSHVRQSVAGQRERPSHSSLIAQGAQVVNQTQLDEQGALRPLASQLDLTADTLLVEIPSEFQALKSMSLAVAQAWRSQTAAIFTQYFANGYAVVDFITDRADNHRRNFYVLSRLIPVR
ncbi:MAG: hypothetical protein ABI947_03040 [Chloroflexota bacterium]